MTTIATHVTAT